MFDLNPYRYDTVEYYEYELKVAQRNLELVTEAAAMRIRQETSGAVYGILIDMSEAVMYAKQIVKSAEISLNKAKDRKPSEDNE